jgi:hypothetical protein
MVSRDVVQRQTAQIHNTAPKVFETYEVTVVTYKGENVTTEVRRMRVPKSPYNL